MGRPTSASPGEQVMHQHAHAHRHLVDKAVCLLTRTGPAVGHSPPDDRVDVAAASCEPRSMPRTTSASIRAGWALGVAMYGSRPRRGRAGWPASGRWSIRNELVLAGVATSRPHSFLAQPGVTRDARGHVSVPRSDMVRRDPSGTMIESVSPGGTRHAVASGTSPPVTPEHGPHEPKPGSAVEEKAGLEPWTGGPADATLELLAGALVRLAYGPRRRARSAGRGHRHHRGRTALGIQGF